MVIFYEQLGSVAEDARDRGGGYMSSLMQVPRLERMMTRLTVHMIQRWRKTKKPMVE